MLFDLYMVIELIFDLIFIACLISVCALALVLLGYWLMRIVYRASEYRLQRKTPNLAYLEQLLSEQKWAAADRETSRIIETTAPSRPVIDWFYMMVFPLDLLLSMDQLWAHYSDGRFGFLAQKEIYDEIAGAAFREQAANNGNSRNYFLMVDNFIHTLQLEKPVKICFLDFADTVGWRINKQWPNYQTFSLEEPMPKGYLPVGQWLPVAEDMIFEARTAYNRSIVFATLMYRLGQ